MTNQLQSTDQTPRNRQLVIDFYRHVFDAYRVRDEKLAVHWSGINKIAPPKHPQ